MILTQLKDIPREDYKYRQFAQLDLLHLFRKRAKHTAYLTYKSMFERNYDNDAFVLPIFSDHLECYTQVAGNGGLEAKQRDYYGWKGANHVGLRYRKVSDISGAVRDKLIIMVNQHQEILRYVKDLLDDYAANDESFENESRNFLEKVRNNAPEQRSRLREMVRYLCGATDVTLGDGSKNNDDQAFKRFFKKHKINDSRLVVRNTLKNAITVGVDAAAESDQALSIGGLVADQHTNFDISSVVLQGIAEGGVSLGIGAGISLTADLLIKFPVNKVTRRYLYNTEFKEATGVSKAALLKKLLMEGEAASVNIKTFIEILRLRHGGEHYQRGLFQRGYEGTREFATGDSPDSESEILIKTPLIIEAYLVKLISYAMYFDKVSEISHHISDRLISEGTMNDDVSARIACLEMGYDMDVIENIDQLINDEGRLRISSEDLGMLIDDDEGRLRISSEDLDRFIDDDEGRLITLGSYV